jgi:excinuclease UvrABC nuclease subunit
MGLFYFMNLYLFKNENISIKENEWKTPNTYGNNFSSVPKTCGVYLLVVFNNLLEKKNLQIEPTILYVGSSINLQQRREKHEVKRHLQKLYDYIYFYFKETDNYKNYEIELIKNIHPKFNTQHNG